MKSKLEYHHDDTGIIIYSIFHKIRKINYGNHPIFIINFCPVKTQLCFFNSLAYEPLFAQFQKSRYSAKLLLSINQTQSHILTNRLDSDPERILEIRDTIELEESPQVIFHDNPLKS